MSEHGSKGFSLPVRTVISRIEGRVQGVGFRAWVMREAQSRDISGWVRNCSDGTVEAVFSGELGNVIDMQMRCYIGPPGSRPVSVITDPCKEEPQEGFEIRS
ncbi:MAG: acylphosphatase [Alphaproteobacteria bacterium]